MWVAVGRWTTSGSAGCWVGFRPSGYTQLTVINIQSILLLHFLFPCRDVKFIAVAVLCITTVLKFSTITTPICMHIHTPFTQWTITNVEHQHVHNVQ